MPELPEVEITRRGIEPLLVGKTVSRVVVRVAKLRFPVPAELATILPGQTIQAVERRGKYLLLRCPAGHLVIHLGMSGHLQVLAAATPPGKHDHLDIVFANGSSLRYTDPRRFGAILWTVADPLQHPLLAGIGPEPLTRSFDGGTLFQRSRGRSVAIKQFIMDSRIVAGVGNIYANEALFRAGILPDRAAGSVTLAKYEQLAVAIKEVLLQAIDQGGTTLRDFRASDGRPGYFRIELQVYDRGGEPCSKCGAPLQQSRLGQRSTYFCSRCQK